MDLAPIHPWVNLLHVLSAMAFIFVHGGAALVAFKLREERDPARIQALLEFVSAYLGWGWIALAAVLVSGVVAGLTLGWWTSGQLWIWASLGVFLAVAALMTPTATAYLNEVRHAVGLPTYADERKKLPPPPPAAPEELERVLRSPRPMQAAIIGLGGIAILTWLMMMKPF